MMTMKLIAMMLALASPSISRPTREAYSRILVTDTDPATLAALVTHESAWRPSAVGGLDGACVGLAQRCLRFEPACAADEDLALNLAAPACLAVRQRLLVGTAALRELVVEARAWRRYCRKTTGRAAARNWLSGYSGSDHHGVTCGRRRVRGRWRDVKMSRVVFDILSIRQRILGGRHER